MAEKQNASLDASFWINVCVAGTVEFVIEYFNLFVNSIVAAEIRFPLEILGISARTTVLFNDWVQAGRITLVDPAKSVGWFQEGENAAVGLAIEYGYFLLMDDANPYHRARAAGLRIAGSSEFAILLYDHGRITGQEATAAIQATHASKRQKRVALMALETLKRLKGN